MLLPKTHAGETSIGTRCISAWVRREIPDFFGGMHITHGTSRILCALLDKFYDAAKAAGCVQHFDPQNETRLATLLANCNFEDVAALKSATTPAKPKRTKANGKPNA